MVRKLVKNWFSQGRRQKSRIFIFFYFLKGTYTHFCWRFHLVIVIQHGFGFVKPNSCSKLNWRLLQWCFSARKSLRCRERGFARPLHPPQSRILPVRLITFILSSSSISLTATMSLEAADGRHTFSVSLTTRCKRRNMNMWLQNNLKERNKMSAVFINFSDLVDITQTDPFHHTHGQRQRLANEIVI